MVEDDRLQGQQASHPQSATEGALEVEAFQGQQHEGQEEGDLRVEMGQTNPAMGAAAKDSPNSPQWMFGSSCSRSKTRRA